MRLLIAATIGLLIFAPLTSAQSLGDFDEIFIFGDSLTDQGNIAAATFGFVPGPAYFNGRFSNGPLWVDNIAAALGLPTSANGVNFSVQNGNNYAIGSARVADSQSIIFLTIPSVRLQISSHLASTPTSATTLYVVNGGGNDLRDALDPSFNLGGMTDLAYVSSVAQELAAGVQDLVDAGARYVLVGNSPDIGLTPESVIVNNNSAQATLLTTQFNQTLALELQAIRDNEDVCILELDFFALTQDIAFDALTQGGANFGITNISTPVLPGFAGSLGADPTISLFVDDIHPTALGHQFAADRVLEALASARLPGSGEDFDFRLRVDGFEAPSSAASFATTGQTVELNFSSPGGTLVGAVTTLLGQAFAAGSPPSSPAGFPELYVNQSGAVNLGVFGVFSTGTTLNVPVVPGLAGARLILQPVISTPSALNGFFVASDARELVLF
jgi:outer membrane lipase/esterase